MHINSFALLPKDGDVVVPTVVVGAPAPMSIGDGYHVKSVHKGDHGQALRESLGVIVGSEPVLVARDAKQAQSWKSLKLEAIPITIGLAPSIKLDARRAWMVKLPPKEFVRASGNSVEAFEAFTRGEWPPKDLEEAEVKVETVHGTKSRPV